MRALVTGACGFVGGYLVRHLLECGDEVCGTYLGAKRGFNCKEVALDISDAEQCRKVIQEFQPEVVYHLAGMAFPPDAEKNFAKAVAINVVGTFNVLDACKNLGSRTRVILVSSAQVYGKSSQHILPLREDAPLHPADNYSLSKVMSESVALRFADPSFFSTIILRPFNHIGAGQRVEFAVSNFANQLAQIAKKLVPPVLRVGNLTAQRDFTDVRDIVRGYRLAAVQGKGVYNLCSGIPVPMQDILDRLIKISGTSVSIEQDLPRMRASDTPVLYGSADKAASELGWKPKYSLEDSLRDTYEYWLKSLA
ncbi:MAG: GDP-mannose 4,6-dehydratase [Deltaproteobacteria bacterium]|nr:GDP-mannose 4,6-dehydratase [Deltaproteobacteria bacterium]